MRCRVYKGSFSVLGRSSETSKLYDASESSMDEIGDLAPSETGGFITVSFNRCITLTIMLTRSRSRLSDLRNMARLRLPLVNVYEADWIGDSDLSAAHFSKKLMHHVNRFSAQEQWCFMEKALSPALRLLSWYSIRYLLWRIEQKNYRFLLYSSTYQDNLNTTSFTFSCWDLVFLTGNSG